MPIQIRDQYLYDTIRNALNEHELTEVKDLPPEPLFHIIQRLLIGARRHVVLRKKEGEPLPSIRATVQDERGENFLDVSIANVQPYYTD